MDNNLIQQVLDKVLKDNQTPARIKAYAEVIRALKNTNPPPVENEVKAQTNDEDLMEDKPINFSEITGLDIDGKGREEIHIEGYGKGN